MRSGQKSVRNPITFITTTGYPESNSIMNEEIEYAEAVLNGVIKNQRYFALLYFAEEKHLWDDIGLMQANPLRIEENYQEIRDHRVTCKFKQSEETEYLTKEMNVLIDTVNEDENYLDMKSFRKCKVDKIDFSGREVVVSVDYWLYVILVFHDMQPSEHVGLKVFHALVSWLVLNVEHGRQVAIFEMSLFQEEIGLCTGR